MAFRASSKFSKFLAHRKGFSDRNNWKLYGRISDKCVDEATHLNLNDCYFAGFVLQSAVLYYYVAEKYFFVHNRWAFFN